MRTVYLENGVLHAPGCPELVERMFPMDEEKALRDWPRARWHSCTWEDRPADDPHPFAGSAGEIHEGWAS